MTKKNEISESFFKIAPTNIDEYTKKLLNLQHENMRPQRNIDINDRILDEKYQNIKIYDKNMMKEIRSVQLKRRKKIEDKEIVQMKNLSTDIEKMNGK